jgi:hypothetical protein
MIRVRLMTTASPANHQVSPATDGVPLWLAWVITIEVAAYLGFLFGGRVNEGIMILVPGLGAAAAWKIIRVVKAKPAAEGIGGWLLVLAGGLIIRCLSLVLGFFSVLYQYEHPNLSALIRNFDTVLNVEAAGVVVALAIATAATVTLFAKHGWFRILFTLYAVVDLSTSVINMVIEHDLLRAEVTASDVTRAATNLVVLTLAVSYVWLSYRVRNTFVRRRSGPPY